MPRRKLKKTATSGSRAPRSKRVPKLLKDGSVPEKVIQRQILDWLQESGLLHWRQNAGEIRTRYGVVKLGPDGISDIVVIIPPSGRFLGLEVKSAKGTLRPAQKEFKVALEATGGYYRVVRSLTQAMDAVAAVVGKELWDSLKGRLVLRLQPSDAATS